MFRSVPLGALTPSVFLKRYWQKSPHLIRQAFPRFSQPIGIGQFLDLACEPGVESRLVQRTPQPPYWRVRHGAFTRKYFRGLPTTNWTLLVQDCDKHLPLLAQFLVHFDFIPNWRIDDLMISYAVAGGSVGPHVDAYDVFLLQAYGRRRWDISRKPQQPRTHPQLDLKLVENFKPENSWVLEAGDMLYLPPGVAHHGVALGEGLTFSIGFRSPSDAELLADLNSTLLTRIDPQSRYTDRHLKSAHMDPGRISLRARATIRRRIRTAQHLLNAQIDEWFGCFVTEPKPWLVSAGPRLKLNATRLRRRLTAGTQLQRHPAARMAWFRAGGNQAKLFVNGHCYKLPLRLAALAQLLCRSQTYTLIQLQPWLRDRIGGKLLAELYNAGILRFI